MKKKNDLVRAISSIVLGSFLAILLFAPNVKALSIPSGETMTIDNDVQDMLEIFGTAILEGDAEAFWIYAFPGAGLNEPGSTVHIYGCAPNNSLAVLQAAGTQWLGLDPVVTIYGSRFKIDDGLLLTEDLSFAPPADEPISGTLHVLDELDEVQFSIWIASDVAIHLRDPDSKKELERVEAELKISPSVMNLNRRYPFVCAKILLPEGIEKDDVDNDYPLMIQAGENGAEVEAQYTRIFQSYKQESSPVKIFAFFNIGTLLKDLPEDCEQMQLQVCGLLKTEQEFYGNDNIKILKPHRKHWSYMKNWKSRRPSRHR